MFWVRTAVREPLYYAIDIIFFLNNTGKYFQLVEKKQSYSPLVFFSTQSAEPDNIREAIYFTIESDIKIFITQNYINIGMATAGKHDKLNIQITFTETAISHMFTQIDDIYKSNILNNNNKRKLSSFSEVLKRKYLTLQQYEDQLIDILTESNKIKQFYEESINFEIVYQETLTLINDLVIERMKRTTTTHQQPITGSAVNNEEDVDREQL